MKILSVEFEKRCRAPKDFPVSPLPEIAFAGRSNVGKSSLMNCLLNRRGLVAVSSKPGKTRAIDFYLVNKEFRLVDLPGYGFAKVPEEMQRNWKVLIESYLSGQKNLAGVVWILDIRRDLSDLDLMLQEWLRAYSILTIPVCTKADKIGFGKRPRRQKSISKELGGEGDLVLFSAKTGLGKAALWKRILAVTSGFEASALHTNPCEPENRLSDP